MKTKIWHLILFGFITITLAFSSCSKSPTSAIVTPTNPGSGDFLDNVIYGQNINYQGKNESLSMDIYFPTNMVAGKKYPLAITIHGGGYISGTKESAGLKCQILADSGFVAATIDYRVGWNASSQACIGDMTSLKEATYRANQDINAALRFLVSKATEYSIDTSWIFVSGGSAGACIALSCAYNTDAFEKRTHPDIVAKLGGLNNATNRLTNPFTIKGICSIAGAIEDSTLITRSSACPTIFFQGGADDVIPLDQGYYLGCTNFLYIYGTLCQYRQLATFGKSAVAHILPGSAHGNNGDSGYDNPFMISNTACFFHSIMRKAPTQYSITYGTINSCL